MRREKWVKFTLSGIAAVSMIPSLAAPLYADEPATPQTSETTTTTKTNNTKTTAKAANTTGTPDPAKVKVTITGVTPSGKSYLLYSGPFATLDKDNNWSVSASEIQANTTYTLASSVTGDLLGLYQAAEDGNLTVNIQEPAAATKKVYVSYIQEDGTPFENGIETIELDAGATTFNTSILKAVPKGYEIAEVGDRYIGDNDTINIVVRPVKAEKKTVYVSYIHEDDKTPFENGIEKIELDADATTFSSSVLKEVPKGYELCEVGDYYIGDGDTINVEVRPVKAEKKKVYVSYIHEEDMTPFENGIETIELDADATYFNTSILKEVPKGYEIAEVGDRYIGNNDTINIVVRSKKAETKTVYVSYIHEDDKTPFENGIEKIELPEGATYFNTSILKEVPKGYEVCEVGDRYIGDNDTINIEVRPVATTPETKVASAVFTIDPVKGHFDEKSYQGVTTLHFDNIQESGYAITEGGVPAVYANDGYTWTGWTITNSKGESVGQLGTDAKEIQLPKDVADTYTIEATFTKNDKPGQPDQPTKPGDKGDDKGNTKTDNKTNTNTASKNTQATNTSTKKAEAQKADATKTDGVNTGAASGLIASLSGVAAAGAGILAVLRKKKDID